MIKLHLDWISQPSRAVKAVLDILKIPHEVKALKIQFKENQTPEFAKINPLRQVPVIEDGDFRLTESHAIMKYLIRSRNIVTELYPYHDISQAARIDEYLDFHHTNTRKSLGLYHNVLIAPKYNEPLDTKTEYFENQVQKTLEFLDRILLARNPYLCGKHLTIADISACSELMQLLIIKYDFSPYQNVDRWMFKVFKVPEVEAAHFVALKIIKKQNPSCRYVN